MNSPNERLRIVVLGYIVRGPLGGLAWHHLQYVLGLRALGHEVIFLEDSDDYPSCYDPTRHTVGSDPTYGLNFTANVFARVGIGDCWAYYDAHVGAWHGPLGERTLDFCKNADICLNVSGVNPLRPWVASIPSRVLIDTDPVFTQIKHLTNEAALSRANDHTVFFTFGENIASAASSCPDDGFDWKATRQPIVLDAWSVIPAPADGCFTTVMQWESYKSVSYDGRRFGMKSTSLKDFLNLPKQTQVRLELALGSERAPRELLRAKGWSLRDPLEVTLDPWTYQNYIQKSRGEFSVAKHGYVAARSGWFSERSAAYLASARPAVVQDTGFSSHLPVGEGLIAFSTIEQAAEALRDVESDYARHSRAAREIAESCFDSRLILSQLIDNAMCEG